MSEQKTANVFNIPAGEPFIEHLLLLLHTRKPKDLLDTIIFLPTNRSARLLHNKFEVLISKSNNIAIPKIFSFNDINNDDTIISILNTPKLSKYLKHFLVKEKSPIDEFSRILILSNIIKQQSKSLRKPYSEVNSIIQAKEFAKLIDNFFNSGANLRNLKILKENDVADHQLEVFNFLDSISNKWEEILEKLGVIDLTLQTSKRLNSIAKILKENNYEKPIIAAGSTGTLPSTRNLLKAISYLPQGELILPGLDTKTNDDIWNQLDECHPQYGLKTLLDEININRSNVKNIKTILHENNIKSIFLNEAMKPGKITYKWHEFSKNYDSNILKNSLRNISLIECINEDEEANTIAFIIRKALCENNKTIRFITADRYLS